MGNMLNYQIYGIDRDGMRIGDPIEFLAHDDRVAKLHARKALAQSDIEIWQEGRLVGWLESDRR